MFDSIRHKTILVKILKEIYADKILRTALGFKGGTAAYLFYDLPRLSVDLDFDLLDPDKKEAVFENMKNILPSFGKVTQAIEKRYTLFYLLNYEKDHRNIKIEISKRPSKSSFEVKSYLGLPMLLMKKEDITANKLAALLMRPKFASRDIYDLWYFLKSDWDIDENVVKEKTGLTLKKALRKAISRIVFIKPTLLLSGWGEFIDDNQKAWVKTHLKEELVFLLKLRMSTD